MNKQLIKTLALAAGLACGSVHAGDVYLTGHDVDLHDNQNGYDHVILDYLRGSTAASAYRVGIVSGPSGSFNIGTGYGTRSVVNVQTFATGASFASFLSGIDVLIVASEQSCGGCRFTPADVVKLNSFRPEVTTFFNAGGDIFGLTGASNSDYYGFLPSSAVASGAPIGGSSGFTATAAGAAIGITSNMINGFPTHNRFTSFAPAFTVMETRGDEIISLALQGGRIDDGGGIVIGPPVTPAIPEPETYALMLAGLGVLGVLARRRKATR